MNQQEQKWLVLLYSLIELDGGGAKESGFRAYSGKWILV